MTTILVLTGTTQPLDITIAPAEHQPDVVLSDLTEFIAWMDPGSS